MKAQLKFEPAWSRQQRLRLARPPITVLIDHAVALARRIAAASRRASQRVLVDDPRGVYLSKAVDHVDLERRLRAWDDYEQDRLRWPPTL